MAKLFNLARMTTATVGAGTITLGSAVTGFLTFANAGVANLDVVTYSIKDGANSEIGYGTYTSSGTTLTRNVTKSTNSNAAISLSGSAEVAITGRAEDLQPGILTLTDGATINWAMEQSTIAKVTLAGNRTVAAPTNLRVAAEIILEVNQDGTGSRTLTWNSVFKWPGGIAPTLTTAASAKDVFSFYCDGTNLYGTYMNDVK
jgi:hypothetical protein